MFDRVLKTALYWNCFSDYHSQIDIRKSDKIAASSLETFKMDRRYLTSFENHYDFLTLGILKHFGTFINANFLLNDCLITLVTIERKVSEAYSKGF